MLQGSGVRAELWLKNTPFIPKAMELAGMGMLPEGSFANRNFCASLVKVDGSASPLEADLVFDAQTSGGLLLAVPEARLDEARRMLEDGGDLAAHVGQVLTLDDETEAPRLLLR